MGLKEVLRVCMAFHGENFPPPMKDHRLTLNRFSGETLTVRFSFFGETLTLTVEPFFCQKCLSETKQLARSYAFLFLGACLNPLKAGKTFITVFDPGPFTITFMMHWQDPT